MSKISPLYNMLKCNLVQLGIFHELLSVDKSMVQYFGCHSAKMLIRGKPIRFGYNIWCLFGSDDWLSHADISGKTIKRDRPAFRNTCQQ